MENTVPLMLNRLSSKEGIKKIVLNTKSTKEGIFNLFGNKYRVFIILSFNVDKVNVIKNLYYVKNILHCVK